jgi:predicted nucleic acid-binding Zn ribbon protein
MPTYVYETTSSKRGAKPHRFEFKQSMNDAPLTKHPETGESIRRVVLGGFGVLSSKSTSNPTRETSGSSCGPGCGCH